MSHYAMTRFDSGYTRTLSLYAQNNDGEFEKICTANNVRYFLGNKIIIQDRQIYIYDTARNIVAQPQAGCSKLELINTLFGSMYEDRMMYEEYENTIDRIIPNQAD